MCKIGVKIDAIQCFQMPFYAVCHLSFIISMVRPYFTSNFKIFFD